MPAVGVDISNESVKYISLKRAVSHMIPDRIGKLPLPAGVVEHGLIKRADELVDVLKKIQRETRCSFAHVSLPEEHAYLFEISLPSDQELSVEQALEFHLKENVPLSPDEVIIDYLTLDSADKEHLTVSVSVYPIRIVQQYLEAFLMAGLEPLSFEIEAHAIARALVPKERKNETVMLVDLGASDAGIAVVSEGVIEYTATLDTAGKRLTQAVEQALTVPTKEAEEYMTVRGLVETPDNKKVFDAMFPIIESLRDEINKHISYWNAHRGAGVTQTRSIDRVVMCGGNAVIKGLAQHLTAMLSLPVASGNVWVNLCSLDETIPPLPYRESVKYATAVGLVLRSLPREGITI